MTRTRKMSSTARDLKQKLQKINGKKILSLRKKVDPEAYFQGMGKEFYQCRAWRELRWKVLKENAAKYGGKPTCEMCKRNDVPMHCDHKKPRAYFPHLELSKDNLQILCADCNVGKGATL